MALLGASLVVGILLAEGVLRLAGLVPEGGVATVSQGDFDRVPGIFEPNQRVVDTRIPLLAFDVAINGQGYRGSDVVSVQGARRVLMVGDSLTFGDFVDDAETLPAQLEVRLRQCHPSTTVTNAGVGGSSIETQIHMVERGLALGPDLVVLTFYENDIADLQSPLWERLARNRRARARFPLSVAYPVMRRLVLWDVMRRAAAQWRNRFRTDSAAAAGPIEEITAERTSRHRQVYSEALRQLAGKLSNRGTPLVFTTFPSHHSTRARTKSADLAWAESTAVALGLEPVSIWKPLIDSGLEVDQLYLLPLDGHPRPIAYRLAAAHLATQISKLPLFANPCEAM